MASARRSLAIVRPRERQKVNCPQRLRLQPRQFAATPVPPSPPGDRLRSSGYGERVRVRGSAGADPAGAGHSPLPCRRKASATPTPREWQKANRPQRLLSRRPHPAATTGPVCANEDGCAMRRSRRSSPGKVYFLAAERLRRLRARASGKK
jgi:hypothetical protein